MDDKENISYLIRRKANANQRETVNFNQLANLSFDGDDLICADNGKDQWYTYRAFSEEFLKADEEKGPIGTEQLLMPDARIEVDEIVHPDPETVSGDEKKRAEKEKLEISAGETPWISVKATAILIASGIVAILTLAFFFVEPPPSTPDFNPATIALMQREIQKELMEGVRLVEMGDNTGANSRFRKVRNALSANQGMNDSVAQRYSRKYQAEAESLCKGIKTQTFTELANQYYLYAAILSGTNKKPQACQ